MDVNFTARPTAIYKPFKESTQKALTVYELETSDIKFLKKFKKQLQNDSFLKKEKPVYHEIALYALDSIIKSLKLKKNFFVDDKSVAYLAVCENKVTSFIQGNLPKINLAEDKVIHSNRNKAKESELDWLATIPSRDGTKLPSAAAPSVVSELFKYCFKLPQKFKSIYCRSEMPEKCEKSVKFYEKLGFKPVGKPIKMETPQKPIELNHFSDIDNFKYSTDDVLPMAISRSNAKKTVLNISKKFGREEIKNAKSVDLNKLVV